MLRFLVRRTVQLVLLLIATSVITFTIFAVGPSDPAADSCGKSCTPERIEAARIGLGLNRPLVVQYLDYMKGIVAGRHVGPPDARIWCSAPCFGRSFQNNRDVWTTIKGALPYTISVALGAAVLFLVVGVSVGMLAGLKKGTVIDKAAVALSAVGVSLPVPLIGLVFLWLVVGQWGWLPYPSNAITSPWGQGVWPWIQNYLLAWITLALIYAASYVRLTRASMIETMGEDYIRTARAKGLAPFAVNVKHGLRSAITPIVTIFGLDLGALLGGAVLTETIYSVPGIGKTAVQAASGGDLPVTLGIVMFAAFFVITANIVVDILYAVIDPRVRLA